MRQFAAGVDEQTQDGLLATGNYFGMQIVRTMLGRAVAAEDGATPGAGSVAVFSYDLWRKQFGGDRGW